MGLDEGRRRGLGSSGYEVLWEGKRQSDKESGPDVAKETGRPYIPFFPSLIEV